MPTPTSLIVVVMIDKSFSTVGEVWATRKVFAKTGKNSWVWPTLLKLAEP